jgi:two-component system, cell cycle sensor histidine kinase and response regulator CckA
MASFRHTLGPVVLALAMLMGPPAEAGDRPTPPGAVTYTDPRTGTTLLRCDGTVIEVWATADGSLVLLVECQSDTGGPVAHLVATLPPGTEFNPGSVPPGTRVRLTGSAAAPADVGAGFGLRLRDASDVEVLARPTWWTADRVGAGGMVAAATVAAALILLLRRELGRRAEALRAQLRREVELEAAYRDLVESANDVVFTLDRAGRLTSFNRAGERLTGYSRAEIVGRPLFDLSDPHADPERLANTANASRTFEMAIRYRDGQPAIWEVSARPARRDGVLAVTICIARDVTDRKRADAELRRLCLIRDQQFENSPLAFIEWDGRLRVARWSKQAERIFGWSAAEAAGRTLDELGLVHEADAAIVRERIDELIAGAPFNTCANRNRTKDGRVLHVEWYNSTLLDDQGKVICVISLGHDISDRVREEERRRKLEEQVRQSQKMEAVGRLAGGVAHDFNNLLTVINGCADLLLREAPADAQTHELADEIRRAGEQAAALTKQLLAFGRRQIVAPTVLDLNDVVREVERMLRRLIGEHIELAVELDPAGGRVKADPSLLAQLLMNLAVNARDAMPQGGTLTVRTAQIGDKVVVTVADTGVGMDAATRARIFEPFFTTKPVGEGTGLGLATVHSIVEQAGGAIAVESEPNRGTTFRIELPACHDVAPAKATVYVRRADLRSRETILLVEDEDLVRSLARRVLEGRGYQVYAAPCGAEALELFDQLPGRPDLVVTDVVMPGMGGRELAERLRDRQPDLPVLFMSGYTTDDVLRQGIQAEAVHFLQKPFTPDSLARKVRDVLLKSADGQPASADAPQPTLA